VTFQLNILLPATGKVGGTHEMEISPDRGITIPFCRSIKEPPSRIDKMEVFIRQTM